MPVRKKNEDEKLVHVDIDRITDDTTPLQEKRKNKNVTAETEGATPKTLGEILRAARLEKHKELEDIAKKTCIKRDYLEALETGRYYAFPDLVYGRGFLRMYAALLGLDVKEMMDLFKKETHAGVLEEEHATPRNVLTHAAPDERGSNRPMKKIMMVAGGVIGTFFVISLLTSQKPVETPVPVVPVTPVMLPAEETSAVVPGQSAEETTAVTPIVQPVVAVPPVPVKAPVVYGQKGQSRLALTATQEVWVEITDPKGKVVFSQILTPNDVYYPPKGSEKYSLNTGNAGALSLSIDGGTPRALGEIGTIKQGLLLDPVALAQTE